MSDSRKQLIDSLKKKCRDHIQTYDFYNIVGSLNSISDFIFDYLEFFINTKNKELNYFYDDVSVCQEEDIISGVRILYLKRSNGQKTRIRRIQLPLKVLKVILDFEDDEFHEDEFYTDTETMTVNLDHFLIFKEDYISNLSEDDLNNLTIKDVARSLNRLYIRNPSRTIRVVGYTHFSVRYDRKDKYYTGSHLEDEYYGLRFYDHGEVFMQVESLDDILMTKIDRKYIINLNIQSSAEMEIEGVFFLFANNLDNFVTKEYSITIENISLSFSSRQKTANPISIKSLIHEHSITESDIMKVNSILLKFKY